MLIMLMMLVVLGLLVIEARWRVTWLRLLLVPATLVWLLLALNLGPASRRTIADYQRTERNSEAGASGAADDFVRGVLAMAGAGQSDLRSVHFPTFVLAWLAISPALMQVLMAYVTLGKREVKPVSGAEKPDTASGSGKPGD